jgi:hypothetical protein
MKSALKGIVKGTSILLPIYMKQTSQQIMTMRVQREAKGNIDRESQRN